MSCVVVCCENVIKNNTKLSVNHSYSSIFFGDSVSGYHIMTLHASGVTPERVSLFCKIATYTIHVVEGSRGTYGFQEADRKVR